MQLSHRPGSRLRRDVPTDILVCVYSVCGRGVDYDDMIIGIIRLPFAQDGHNPTSDAVAVTWGTLARDASGEAAARSIFLYPSGSIVIGGA